MGSMDGIFAYGAPIYNYGGTDNSQLGDAEQAQWNKYAKQGVSPTGVDQSIINNQQQSGNQLGQSNANEYNALNLMKSYAQGAQTPAEKQALQAQSYAQSGQNAMAANAGSGQGLAAARSQAAMSGATQSANNANSNRALAAQEQQNYTKQYQDMSNTIRGNEQNLYGINSNAAYADAQNQMDINKANDALMLGYSGLQQNAIGAQRQIQLGNSNFNLQQSQAGFQNGMNVAGGIMGAMGGAEAGANGIVNSQGGGGGGEGGGGGGGGPVTSGGSYDGNFGNDVANSDVRLKSDIKGGFMSSFLDTLAAGRATYRYKNPADEPRVRPTGGRYAGVMAQALEQDPEIGHQLVIDTPHGKMVDQKTLASAMAAGLGEIHERVRRLEGGR